MTNKEQGKDAITWMTFNNVVPIVTSAVMITISWMTLITRIELLNQKIDYLVKNQEEYFQRNKEVQVRLGDHGLRISRLEVLQGFESDKSATLD